MTKALLIRADRFRPAEVVDIGRHPQHYRRIGSILGGYIEHCKVNENTDTFVSEEAELLGLPLNRRALAYARRQAKQHGEPSAGAEATCR